MLFKRTLLALACCLLILVSNTCLAQGTSNKGTDFWLGYGNHIDAGTGTQQMRLYITSDVNTSGSMIVGGVATPFTVTANAITTLSVPQTAYLGVQSGLITNKGIHLTSLKPIVAYAHIFADRVSGATLVLPTNTLGKEYYSINYSQVSNSNNAYSYFFVVAVEDNTQIVITPSATVQGGVLVPGVASAPITLMKGDIYNVLGTQTRGTDPYQGTDLTGSLIKTVSTTSDPCKKIAVFSGSGKISIGCFPTLAGSGDNLFQQAYPVTTWGNTFATVPLNSRNYDIYRIFKSNPTAVVKLNGAIVPSSNFANNLYYDFSSTVPNYIESDKAIQVVQYATTQNQNINCTTKNEQYGDPEMIYLNPLEQTLTNITMYSTDQYKILSHYINVVIKTADAPSFQLDGVSKSANFLPLTGSNGYSYAQLSVVSGTHNLTATGGFNAIAYGFGMAESYGYAAGANLVSKGIQAQVTSTTNIKATGCVNEPYDFKVTLAYQPTKFTLDLGDGTAPAQVPIVRDTAYQANGQTQYVYKLSQGTKYNIAKTYTIKLFSEKPTSDGCGSTDEFDLDYIVYPVPSPSFTSNQTQACIAAPITLTSTSTDNGNTIVKWYWNYGDGSPVEIRTDGTPFTHAYAKPGDYNVTLMVEGASGCQSAPTPITVIHINKPPDAKFTPQAITCQDQAIVFTDKSIANEGTIVKWTWDFGDANSTAANPGTAASQNPSHTFILPGTYTVKLVVETDKGCASNVFSQTIIIHNLPVAKFEMPDFCLNDVEAKFINKTTIADNSTLTYLWDFGDQFANSQRPNTSTAVDGKHAYTKSGYYTVTLTATSANGCITILSQKFTVNGSTPKAAFNVKNATALCSDQPVQFEDIATVDFGELTRIDWYYDYGNSPAIKVTDDFPDPRAGPAHVYSHLYPAFSTPLSKTITVRMVAFSGSGLNTSCVAEITQTITLKAVPIVKFDLPAACLDDGIAQFTDRSDVDAGGKPLSYLWDFGDGNASGASNSSTAQNPTHAYSSIGTYQVTLTVTAANGCSVTLIKPFVISGSIPKPDFNVLNPTQLCSDQPVIFEDKATLAFGEVTKIEWYFDNVNHPADPAYIQVDNTPNLRAGNTKQYAFLYPVLHFPPISQTVFVRMKAYSGLICVADIVKPITLQAVPLVVFKPLANICLEKSPAQFTEVSETTSFPGTGLYSGDGVSATGIFDPKLAGIGTHTITYTFTGINGCINIKSQNITVYPTPTVDAGKDQVILLGGQAKLKPTAAGSNITYKWIPSTGLSKDDIENPIAIPEDDITYTLTVTSNQGCTASDTVFIKVLKVPIVPNTFTPNGDGVNDTWDIKYLDSYPGATVDIFNRYGAKVYSNSSGYTQAWDGKENGNYLPTGVYYFIVSPKNGRKDVVGYVTIVR